MAPYCFLPVCVMDEKRYYYSNFPSVQRQVVMLNKYTVSQKNAPPLVCYNFDICQRILIFFGRNVTDKVSNQKALYCATPNNLCFCITWQNGETRKPHFFTQMLYQCITRIQLVPPWIFPSFWLATHNSLNFVINAIISGLLGEWFVRRKEVESAAAVGLCCTHNACAPMHWLPERK